MFGLWFALSTALPAAFAGEALTFEAVTTVVHGQGVPTVTFVTGASGNLRATATCGGRTFRLTRDVGPGQRVPLELAVGEGEHACTVSVDFLEANGSEGSMTFDVTVRSLRIVGLASTPDDLDLDAGTLVVRPSRPVSEARLTAFGAKGVQLDQVAGDLSDPGALRFAFDAGGRTVVKLVVEVRDAAGFLSSLTLQPWSYAIPHEDIVFPTGSAEVPAEEVAKLETAWSEVVRAVDLYGSVVEIHLFVGGYTDTVGDAPSNQALSERRARSIAQWFAAKGFPGTVSYQGFGESVLAVPTGDGVDEPANRRAVYLLASQPPVGPDVPRAAWKPLR